MKPGIRFDVDMLASSADGWMPAFPNPADFRFDYFKLLQASQNGLATLPGGCAPKVAIVGAGVAGMTVARELQRCGFQVSIFEASDRIGGRLYTRDNPNGTTQAGMEMGAMRMPFFSDPGDQNSLLGYYLYSEAGERGNGAILTDFPNPGAAPGGTGIYINRGFGPNNDFPAPSLIPWSQGGHPDNAELAALNKKVGLFGEKFLQVAKKYYTQDNDDWSVCWDAIVNYYTNLSFNDLVLAPELSASEIAQKIENLDTFDGNLGGFGMNLKEAELLYTIGTGDGSWGAFYNIGALWFLRCTYFGFDSNLRTVEGLGNAASLPQYGSTTLTDAQGRPLKAPVYDGIQSLVEYLYYAPAPNAEQSLYEAAKLYVATSVRVVEKTAAGMLVTYGDTANREQTQTALFDYVVTSPTQWATQMSMAFLGFSESELPQSKLTARNTQHNISSCKLFFPLTQKYWDETVNPTNKIPQIMVTDTYIQDMYALSWDSKPDDNGVLLASYTWEDDSLKLLPFNEQELSELVLDKLQEITLSTVDQDITQYIDKEKPVSIQWISEPTYIGCSKLYRARNQADNMIDLSYNQNYSSRSGLYFAGENYGVEGGWTEPALRSALDCTLQMLSNANATFNAEGFEFARDYPKW